LKEISNKNDELYKKFEINQIDSFESNYVLADFLGEGCMGSVYKCFRKTDIEKQEPFAVKTTREDDDEKKMAHKKEFSITKELDHKNIIRSFEYFEDEVKGEIHQVMGYIQGKEVLDHIAEQPHGHYTEEDARNLFI